MKDLIVKIASEAGISEQIAEQAVAIILKFLSKEASGEKISQLLEAMPGAAQLVESAGEGDTSGGGLGGLAGGLLGGLMGGGGGGVMAAVGELNGLGLGMDQIQTTAAETFKYAKSQAGDELVDDIVQDIPELGQFI